MSKATLIVPGQEVFRSLYDQTIPKLQNYDSINTKWHAQVGDAVFESVCLALADTISGERRMHTVSAAIGAGKTSFAIASLVAQAQWSELDRKAPHGAVLVVEQIRRAEELYRQLNALWPGKLAVWTTEHDPKCTAWPTLGKKPEATFTRQQLQDYPVIVVTHKFYQDVNYQRARTVVRNGVASKRALTIVDERPDEAPMLEIELSLAQKVREKLVDRYPEIKERLDPLFLFMEEQSYAERNKIVRPKKQETKTLAWFQSYDADELAQTAKDIPGIGDLFDYAKLLQTGWALATTRQTATHYWGYESRLLLTTAQASCC